MIPVTISIALGRLDRQYLVCPNTNGVTPRPSPRDRRGEEMTEKWDDPQLDAAQFAIDRFLNAKQTVSEQMAEIYQSIRDGSATDGDRKRLKGLREQYIALSKEVEDVMGRLLVGKQLPHQKSV